MHSLNIKADQYIGANIHGSYGEAFVTGSADNLASLVHRDVVCKLRGPSNPTVKPNQGSNNPENPPPPPENPLGVGPSAQRNPYHDPHVIFPSIGGADLDPLGRGVGGGMLFDPFSPANRIPPGNPLLDPMAKNLPPGAVPPGARFDPFGPPQPGNIGPKFGGPPKRGGYVVYFY